MVKKKPQGVQHHQPCRGDPPFARYDPGWQKSCARDELLARDKVNLDIFWLRDESLEDSANLPDPDVLAAEIIGDLRAVLEQFEGVAEELQR